LLVFVGAQQCCRVLTIGMLYACRCISNALCQRDEFVDRGRPNTDAPAAPRADR
jgi:hypothetical protein